MDTILAIDPSLSCIGWAVMGADTVYDYGILVPYGNEFDARLNSAYCWADSMGRERGIHQELVTAIEIPVYYKNAKTLRDLAQLCGALRVGLSWHCRTIDVLPTERLSALGLPIRLRRNEAKARVLSLVNAMFELELTTKDHDIADAIAVGVAAQKKLKLEAWS